MKYILLNQQTVTSPGSPQRKTMQLQWQSSVEIGLLRVFPFKISIILASRIMSTQPHTHTHTLPSTTW